MSASCAPFCATSAPATGTWRRAICALTSMSRCAVPEKRWAPAARSRTSTPSASSARRSRPRRGARSRSSRTAARSSRRRGYSIRLAARHARCARRRKRTTTDISRPGPAAARVRRGLRRLARRRSAGIAGRQACTLHCGLRPLGLRRLDPRRRAGDGGILRERAQARGREARRQGSRQLADGRRRGASECAGRVGGGRGLEPSSSGEPRRSHRRGRDLGQDRQGPPAAAIRGGSRR